MILQELLDRANQLAAGVGGDENASALIDSEFTAYEIFPHAQRYVLECMAKNGEDLQDLEATLTIAITAGSGALPSTVIKDAWKTSQLSGRPYASCVKRADFDRYKLDGTGQCDYYMFDGPSTIKFKEAGTSSYTGNIKLVIPNIPDLPSPITDPLTTSVKVNEATILVIADVLRGTLSLAQLRGER